MKIFFNTKLKEFPHADTSIFKAVENKLYVYSLLSRDEHENMFQVTIPFFLVLTQCQEWISQHIYGNFTLWSFGPDTTTYFFDNENDALMFKLKYVG